MKIFIIAESVDILNLVVNLLFTYRMLIDCGIPLNRNGLNLIQVKVKSDLSSVKKLIKSKFSNNVKIQLAK